MRGSPAPRPRRSSPASPLLSRLHSRLGHAPTLDLRFHLAVKARLRLIAKRHRQVVAAPPLRTLAAGDRRLLLRLSRRSWPTKLDMQTHPLAPLPTTVAHGEGTGPSVVSTGLSVLPRASWPSGLESPP